MCINDFNQVHKLVEQVHKLHLNERKDIYRNVDPLPFDEFKKYLREHQYFCFVAEVNDVIVGEIISAAIQIITIPWMFIWENCKEYITAAWEFIKNAVSTYSPD